MIKDEVEREEDRIFSGRLFDARRQGLKDIKHKAHEICRKYNTLDERDKSRPQLIKELLHVPKNI